MPNIADESRTGTGTSDVSFAPLARAAFSALEHAISPSERLIAVEIADRQLEELRLLTATLKASRNHLAPVTRLPPEVMARIFAFAVRCDPVRIWVCATPVTSRREQELVLGWIKITHVCRLWREIALSNPGLWTRLPCLSPEWTTEAVNRARSLPLILQAVACGPRAVTGPRTGVTTALAELANIKELDLTVDSGALWIFARDYFGNAPRLESLRLTATHHHGDVEEVPRTAFRGSLRRLSTLVLRNCYPSWSPSIYTRLVHLEIRILEHSRIHIEGVAPSLGTLLDILGATPKLQTFTLVNACRPVPLVTENITRTLAVSRKLSKFTVTGSIQPTAYFLAHLRLPATTTVAVKCTRGPQSPPLEKVLPWLLTPCVSREPSTPPVHMLSINLTLTTDEALDLTFATYDTSLDPLSVDTCTPQYKLVLKSSLQEYQDQTTSVCAGLPLDSIETLVIAGAHSASVDWWHRTFRATKSVRTVLLDSPRSAGQLLPALAARMPSESAPGAAASATVLFPALDTLVYRSIGNLETIAEFLQDVRRRAGLGHPVQTIQVLGSSDEAVREQLARVVSNVVWL